MYADACMCLCTCVRLENCTGLRLGDVTPLKGSEALVCMRNLFGCMRVCVFVIRKSMYVPGLGDVHT
jgi:hypothetical protein